MSDTNLVLRQSASAALGVDLPANLTASEVMEYAGLANWNLRKTPAFTIDPVSGDQVLMTGRNAVIGDIPGSKRPTFMGDVGDTYSIVQNEQHADFLDTLVDESGAHFTNAGTMYDGKMVIIAMRLPGHIMVGGVDQVDTEIVAINSHNGSTSFTLMATPVRVACFNMLNAARKQASNIYRVRHTRGIEGLVEQARGALDLTFKYLDDFQAQAERMIQTTMTQAQFEAIIQKEFGADRDAAPAVQTRAEHKIGQMQHLFAEAATQDGIRDTAWAGYNAITEWSDHYAPTRGDKEISRAQNAIMNPAFKTRALDLMLGTV